MGHSEKIFETSYQPRHAAPDLISLAFKDHTGDNSELFSMLRTATLRKDSRAPIYPKKEDIEEWEQRNDLTELKERYQKLVGQSSSHSSEIRALAAKMQYIRECLSALRVEQLREEYFTQIDKLRELGKQLPPSIDHISPFKPYKENERLAAREIGLALAQQTELDQEQMSAVADALVAYLRREPVRINGILRGVRMSQTIPAFQQGPVMQTSSEHYQCLFGCNTFSNRGKLTRHNDTQHYQKGTFEAPFQCPRCPDTVNINGPIMWSNHTERIHGKWYSPNPPPRLGLRQDTPWTKDVHPDTCQLCGTEVPNEGCFCRHFNSKHSNQFEGSFDCPICSRNSMPQHVITGVTSWQAHLKEMHKGGGRFGHLHVPPKKRSCYG